MTRSDLALALAVCLATTSVARAEPTAIEKSTADALFQEGKALLDQKAWDAACPKLAESHRLRPGGGVVLALALCHEGQGKLASAWSDYREALSFAKRDKRKDREALASSKVAQIEPRLSHLVVRVTDDAAAQAPTVKVDGVELPKVSWGTPIPIDGGDHAIEASANGKIARTVSVEVAPEKDRREVEIAALDPVVVESAPVPAPAASAPKPHDEAPPSSSAVPWIVGGAGVVALGVSGVFGLTAISKRKEVESACPGDTCTDPSAVAKNDDAKRAATIADVAGGIGLAAIGAAVVLMVLDGRREAPKSAARALRVVGDVSPSGGGVGMVVAW